MHRSLPTLVAALAVGSVLTSTGVAAADSALTPGDTRTIVLTSPESWSAARQVDVTVGALEQEENGCLEPEAEAGDVCDPDSAVGELAGELTATVTLGVGDSTCEPVEDVGRSLDLFGELSTRLTTPAAGGVDCVIIDLTFRNDDASDNVAQSDSLTFSLDLVARDYVDPRDPNERPSSVVGQDGDRGTDAPPRSGPPSTDGAAPTGGDTSSGNQGSTGDQAAGAFSTDGRITVIEGGDRGRAESGGVGDALPGTGVEEPADGVRSPVVEGSVLDRMDAQVSVGDGGVVVQTQSADASMPSLLVAWGSLFVGVVAVGWVCFWMVLRRRRKKAAT